MQNNSVPEEFNPGISHEYYFIRQVLLKGISSNCNLLSGKLMDFGCGSKPYKSLFTNITDYIGVDYNGEGHPHDHETIDVFYDGKTIPFADSSFDSVLCSEVFEHLFEINAILDELNRVMKVGAKMLITCPFSWNLHESPIDYARYTPFALTHLLEKHGFKVIKQEKGGTFVQTLFQMITVYMLGSIFGEYNGKYYKKRPFFSILKNPWIVLHNMAGLFYNWLLPKRQDYYLINVFLVEKV